MTSRYFVFVVYLILGITSVSKRRAEVSFSGDVKAPEEGLALWYRQPAKAWTEAVPIGNRRTASTYGVPVPGTIC